MSHLTKSRPSYASRLCARILTADLDRIVRILLPIKFLFPYNNGLSCGHSFDCQRKSRCEGGFIRRMPGVICGR